MNRQIDWWQVLVIVTLLLSGVVLVWKCQTDSARRAWLREHCTQTRHEEGRSAVVYTNSGAGVASTSDLDCYVCPNGLEECL